MAELKPGEPFGLDAALIKSIDWPLALKRISHDLRSDFIYAPHLSFIYARAGEELIASVKKELQSGTYSPGLPLTIEVPKSFRMRVAVQAKRLGPPYSRPGSILLPRDRIFYQALADQAAPIIDGKTNQERSFSHRLGLPTDAAMFLPTRTCRNEFQEALAKYSATDKIGYILKLDVANFFGSLNQHTLINVLKDVGYSSSLAARLEVVLIRYTGERSSRGILQGLYPSDLFGNFYLTPIDTFLEEQGVFSARYVDDVYVLVESVEAADYLLRQLVPVLRSYDLTLNEAKSVIMPKTALIAEEPDLEALFQDAFEEVKRELEEDELDSDYGFQSEWDEEEEDDGDESDEGKAAGEDDADIQLRATTALFDSLPKYPGHEESIERFCLPLFAAADSGYAVKHVLDSFKKRPSMAQIYAAYLAKFLDTNGVRSSLVALLGNGILTDWQKMWVLAALAQGERTTAGEAVKVAVKILRDAARHDALRAVAAIFVGRFGDHQRRKSLVSLYPNVSSYVQAAIYYSSKFWPSVERSNALASWSGHSELHRLMTVALRKK